MKNLSAGVTGRVRCCGDMRQLKSSGSEALRWSLSGALLLCFSASLQRQMRKRGSEVDILWLICVLTQTWNSRSHTHWTTPNSPLPGLFSQKLLPSVACPLHVSKFLLLFWFFLFVCSAGCHRLLTLVSALFVESSGISLHRNVRALHGLLCARRSARSVCGKVRRLFPLMCTELNLTVIWSYTCANGKSTTAAAIVELQQSETCPFLCRTNHSPGSM